MRDTGTMGRAWGVDGSRREARTAIPLPAAAAPRAGGGTAALAAAFLEATAALPADIAAALAGVQAQTLRKWRRRLPRWLRTETARRLAAHLGGEPAVPATPDEGMRRAFRGSLRTLPAEGR